jgi:hypothetical protein
MGKLVYGVGVNDADYPVKTHKYLNNKREMAWECPIYGRWREMLRRCYSKEVEEKWPSYIGCTVNEEWHIFSNFRLWMVENYKSGYFLDKDLKIKNNTEYSKDTCLFVPPKVNSFIIRELTVESVPKNKKGLYYTTCRDPISGERYRLGTFTSKQDAFDAWLCKKKLMAQKLAATLPDEDALIKHYLISRYEE